MAGHSKFANIKHRKGAQDAKKAKVFTKLQKEITVAAKIGQPDPDFNPRLRNAIIAARAANMPKDKIESAIKKATSLNDGENYEEIIYEGYGPGGVAFIVEALTDNRNRTAGNVRSIFTKLGGNLGESGSVAFMFERVGQIIYDSQNISEDDIFTAAFEANADDVASKKNIHIINCQLEMFSNVRDILIKKFGDPVYAKLTWIAKNNATIDDDKKESVLKLVDLLEDDDDVQEVVVNVEL